MISKSLFKDPSSEYRPTPLWSWNDEITPGRIREQLKDFQAKGFGGAFAHPRPGMMTEYLSEDWWNCFKIALTEAKKLGLNLEIYDENSYPSGFAGGHVPSQLPHCQATGVRMRKVSKEEADKAQADNAKDSVYTIMTVYNVIEFKGEHYVFERSPSVAAHWLGEFPYVNLLRPEVTKKFIELTHEEYYKRFKAEFGKTINLCFFDEPRVVNLFALGYTLPFSRFFAVEFEQRKGYDLIPEIPKLFLEIPGYQKIRYDFYDTVHALFMQNFAKPLNEWCRQHGVKLTGHYDEHSWLHPHEAGLPNAMAAYEHQDVPGIDMLECTVGRVGVTKSLWRTIPLLLLTVRELQSAKNQVGQKRTLCETYGVGGYDSTFEDYKRIGDWLYVHGVNYQNQHLSCMTIRGSRKRDHPQSFSEVACWWPHYRPLNDYFGRLSAVLSQGNVKQRILFLHPTTSGWLESSPVKENGKLEALEHEYTNLVQYFCDRFWDFDFGDEYIMENRGSVAGKKLKVGLQAYEVVVVPAHIRNIRSSTLALLEKFTRNGGTVFMLGEAPAWVDGTPSTVATTLAKKWKRVANDKALDRRLEAMIGRPFAVTSKKPLPSNVAVMRRDLDDKTVGYFFTNMSHQRVKFDAAIPERGLVEDWDCLTGEIRGLTGSVLPIEMAHAESALFVIHKDRAKLAPKNPMNEVIVEETMQTLNPTAVHRGDLNTFTLDYCDLECRGKEAADVHFWQANRNISQAHGFDRGVWDNAIQHKRVLLDQDNFSEDTGFEARFHFEVATVPSYLELALECPEFYQIAVNGKPLSFKGSKKWLDPHLRLVKITDLVRKGRNTVTIIGKPYRIRMELEAPILRGTFAVEPAKKGFRIVAERPLTLGSWREQGQHFYSDKVEYRFSFTPTKAKARSLVRLPDWAGTMVMVAVNGKDAGQIAWPQALSKKGGYELDVSSHVRPGKNSLSVIVYGNPKNLFGPFHCYEEGNKPPRAVAWPAMWHETVKNQPAGAMYDFVDYGLFKPVELVEITST